MVDVSSLAATILQLPNACRERRMFKEKVMKALLRQGYFPKELPSAFTTEDFSRDAPSILADWSSSKLFKTDQQKIKKKRIRGSYNYSLPNAEIEVISTPKRGYERRDVHITHPLPQTLLGSGPIDLRRAI